jgi:aspartyl-tRNA(Asn)/glutamyl-tRNA(Gln) amidotransferase subunit A
MSKLFDLSVKQTKELLKKKEISVMELVDAHLNRAEAFKHLNAFTALTPEIAHAQAAEAQKRYDKGEDKILDGIPMGVKDLYCTKGVESEACSNILRGFKPEYESTVTSNLFANGGIMIGKTNMDEFAMGSANLTSSNGAVINPWKRKSDDKNLTPGGSSGGSSAAVAAKLCIGALGSDTGGSIRQPAAFTGIVGIKPTYGRCSRRGMIAFASSLDQAGVFGRNIEDAAIMLEAISGYDPKDSTSANLQVPNFASAVNSSVKGMRIGIPKEYMMDGMPKEIQDLWAKGASWLKEQGAEIIEISLPHTQYALPCYYIIAPAEASSNLARYDGVRYGNRVTPEKGGINEMYEETRAKGFGNEVKRRIMIGTYVLSAGYYDAYYSKAQKIRRLIANDFNSVFTKVDAILTPTTPSAAFANDEKIDDPVKMYLNDIFTVTVNLAGLPGISIPAGYDKEGLPLGLQVITKAFDEISMIRAGAAIERAAKFEAYKD